MGSALERFRSLARSDVSDNSPNSPQKPRAGSDPNLSGPIVPIVCGLDGRDEAEERAAIIEYDSAIPRPWALGYALLLTVERPDWLSVDQWQAYHDTAGKLLASWAAQMERLGWNPADVLGVDERFPEKPWEPSCLLSGLIGVTVGALSQDRISIIFPDGATRCLERNKGKWIYA